MARRKSKGVQQIGYDPDSFLAELQIRDLVKTMNSFKSKTAISANPKSVKVVRVTLTQTQEELRLLVERWMRSGPNLRKMFTEMPELEGMTRYGVTTFWPTETGRGHLEWVARPSENVKLTPKEEAVQDFMTLIANPYWWRLGGPCARCNDYYWRKDKRHKVYCSRNCSALDTALSATKRARQRAHEVKIKEAQAAIDKWCEGKHKGDWKKWVEHRTRGKNDKDWCSVLWLTRWVNRKELIPPKPTLVRPFGETRR
jgi:hypothetical protein